MFQSLIDEFRQEYQQRIVIYEEFSNILEQFGKLDKRCQLDDSTKSQIYTLLQEKQQVTYQAIEVLIFEFLIQQPVEQEELRIDYDNLGPFASKLPKDMLESITPEFLQQFTNFFKLIANKLGLYADWVEIEKLGRDVQRQSKVNTIELLRYIQPFVDAQRKVLVKDLLCLINDLERLQIGLRVQTQISENQNQNQIKEKEIKDSSSDDEKKLTERKDLANTIYQQADYLGKKYVKTEGQKLVGEICKAVQTLEQQQKWMEQELEEKNKRMEEMIIQRELVQGALNQFDYDIKQKDQQMEQLLYDLDQIQAQLYQKMDQNDELVKKLQNYNEELKEVSKYESEVRIKEIELKRIMEQNVSLQKELERITLNNKSLLQIIKELEQQNKEDQPTITKTQTVIEYDDTEIKELQDKVNQLQDYQMILEQNNTQNQKQMIDLQRELTHYKGLYENIFKENNQLRSSIMPRNSIRTSVLPNNTNRCSTLKIPFGNTNNHLSFIGRTSSTRYSSIKGNTGTIHSNFNPLDDLRQSNQLRIEEADDDSNDQNPDQKIPITVHIRQPPPRFDPKFQSSQLNQIKEEDDQEDQTIIQPDRISDKNDKNKNKMMWDLSQFLDNQNINEQDPKFYEFDENIIYATDFLGIREDKKIAEILKLERRTNKAIIQRCFSDSVYRIDHKGKKSRRILFVTEFNVYIFEGETKPQKITRQFPIQNIHTIIFSESSPVLCSIQIAGNDDYLIETFKRSEFNTYLTEIFASRKFKLYQLDFRLNFKVKFKGQKEPIPIESIQQKQGYLDHGKMSAYKVSSNKGSYSTNIGWLQLYSKKVFHNNWQEVFVLLTNVGLIIFKKPGDMEPILFISLVDALVIKNPITEYNKPHILKIRYETSLLDFHFSASSGTLLDQWHDLVQQVIMEQVKQQNKQLEQQQSDIVKQRTQTLIEQNHEITN